MITAHPLVRIDQAHIDLIAGLVKANKPKITLEIGMGSGSVTDAIIQAQQYNQIDLQHTVVDNWHDWNFNRPPDVDSRYPDVNIITATEYDFVHTTDHTFDFIISDGDHHNAERWFGRVYNELLNPGGILIYHDVNTVEREFLNLLEILYYCQTHNIRHHLFNQNSRSDERCQRGLMVIFK